MASVAVNLPRSGMMATPPATHLKRKLASDDRVNRGANEATPSSQLPSSPSKRLKVTFNPDVDVRVVEDWNEKGIELVREEVRRGISGHVSEGNSTGYDQLRQLFTTKPSAADAPSSRLLRKYVVALTGSIRWLNKQCSGLVRAIVGCEWLRRDGEFITVYLRFLGALVSAHPGYIHEVLYMLIRKFTELPLLGEDDDDEDDQDEEDDEDDVRSANFDRVHHALKYLHSLIPSVGGTLFRVLADSFPYPTSSKQAHVDFVSNMLRIPSYAPEMRNAILGLAMDRVAKLDVQLQRDAEDLQEEYDEIMAGIVHHEQHDEDGGYESEDLDNSDGESEADLPLGADKKRILLLKECIDKLDELMVLLFRFYQPIFAKGSRYDIDEVFDHMLTQFTNLFLPTFRSRYTQFLIFHFAQTNPLLAERFVATCIRILLDTTRSDFIRLAAASYLASFVSRAKHVSSDTISHAIDVLCQHLESQRKAHETDTSVPDPHRFPNYYFTAQAILYIFCFRWREFMDLDEDEDDDEFIEKIVISGEQAPWIAPLQQIICRNICSRLNPLKVCAPEIVDQFDKIATALKFTFATSLIAANKRLRISRPTVAAIAGYGSRDFGMPESVNDMFQLESFFPFDPYHLPGSKSWVVDDYIDWNPPPGMMHDADEEDQRDTSEERYYRDAQDDEDAFVDDAGSESDVSL